MPIFKDGWLGLILLHTVWLIITELVYNFFLVFWRALHSQWKFTDLLYSRIFFIILSNSVLPVYKVKVFPTIGKIKYHEKHKSRFGFTSCNIVVLLSHLCRGEHVVAHMRPSVVVEVDDVFSDTPCIFKVLGPLHVVEPFFLYNAVDSFCNGIISWFVVLCHAYGRMDFFQAGYIRIAAVLRSAVGMMRQKRKIHSSSLFYGRIKGRKSVYCLKAVRKFPADNFMSEGVGYQMEVNDTFLRIYICNVGHPKLSWPCRNHTFRDILILEVVVVRVSRVSAAWWLQHEVTLVHEPVKPVASNHQVGIYLPQHIQQLLCSYAWRVGTNVVDCLDYGLFLEDALVTLGLAYGIIAFSGLAKQSAQQLDG